MSAIIKNKEKEDYKKNMILEIKKYLYSLKKEKIDITTFLSDYNNETNFYLNTSLLYLIDFISNEISIYDLEESKKYVIHVIKAIPDDIDTEKLVYQFYVLVLEQIIITTKYLSIYPSKNNVISILDSVYNLFKSLVSSTDSTKINEKDKKELFNKIDVEIEKAKINLEKAQEKNEQELKESIIATINSLQALKAMFSYYGYGIVIKLIIKSLSAYDNDYAYWISDLKNKLLYNAIFDLKKIKEGYLDAKSEKLKNMFLLHS
ncbi:MAG: hypothetical protein AABZ74_00760 [Cyanobacteriota bacterium]